MFLRDNYINKNNIVAFEMTDQLNSNNRISHRAFIGIQIFSNVIIGAELQLVILKMKKAQRY